MPCMTEFHCLFWCVMVLNSAFFALIACLTSCGFGCIYSEILFQCLTSLLLGAPLVCKWVTLLEFCINNRPEYF